MPRPRSGTGQLRPAILSRANADGGKNSFSFPLRLIADDGDATPYPCIPGSEAFRFVCFSCIASRDSQCSTAYPGRQGFRRMFQRGRSRLTCSRTRRSSKLSNSRNCSIITTSLHIVNHCSKHLKRQGFRVSSAKSPADALPSSLKLCNLETLKPCIYTDSFPLNS